MGGFDKNNPKFETLTVTNKIRSTNPLFGIASVPCGVIVPWISGVFSDAANGGFQNRLGSGNGVSEANAHLNSSGFFVCDGSEVNISNSPIFNGSGRFLPNITDDRFICGNSSCGGVGGENNTPSHSHTFGVNVTVDNHTALALSNHTDLAHTGMAVSFNSSVFGSNLNTHSHYMPSMGVDEGAIYLSLSRGNSVTTDTSVAIAGFSLLNQLRRKDMPTNSTSHTSFASSTITCSVTQPASHSSISHSFSQNISSHSVSGNGDINMASISSENRPKYLSILYIMKVV